MRCTAALLLMGSTAGPLAAQNLVPNPSFELVTSCPSFASQLDRAAPWYNPTLGTPELYHGCAPLSSYVSVPDNTTGGFQYARTGQGYIGLYTWRTDVANMREYAEVQLLSPLEADQCYRVEFFVNMPNDQPYACDRIGAYFSLGPVQANDPFVLPFTPHVEHPAGTLITDTLNWTQVSGVYTATGGETHLTIGNFRNDANTQAMQVHFGTWYSTSAYLLIDDVTVEPVELEVELGPDTLLCDGNALLLDATNNGAAYAWSDGSTGPTLTVSEAGTYWVQVSLGTCSASDTITITGGGPPELSLPSALELCPGASAVLDASSPGADIMWMDGDTNAVRVITEPGTYKVTAVNVCGSITAATTVRLDLCPCVPFLPNAFTPNGDGINDLIAPIFHCAHGEVEWSVFDRWGRQVYSASGPVAWDGTADGHPLPSGIYIWQARLAGTIDGTGRSGHLTLLR